MPKIDLNGLQNLDDRKYFSDYLHKTGAQMLQMRLSKDFMNDELEKEELKKKKMKLNKIIRRKINAVEMDDDLNGILMDKEWDTSLWSNKEIVAGCEALIMIFQTDEIISDEKKAQAILMLEKLIFRHDAASEFLRNSLDPLISKAASKKYKGGQSAACLNLLNILHNCREKFVKDFSEFKFINRMCDLVILEAKLASILIQHAYRTKKDRERPQELLPTEEGFGSATELSRLRFRALSERANELRAKWNTMHWLQKKHERLIIGGVRGPVHITSNYMNLILDIIITLVSKTGGHMAHSNREDLIRGNIIILLCGFIACPSGQYSIQTAKILHETAKCAESLSPMIHSGIANCTLKYIKHFSKNLNDMVVSKTLLDSINIIQQLGLHASGVLRARGGYDFIKPKFEDVETTDYRIILSLYGEKLSEKNIANYLSPSKLMIELKNLLLSCRNLTTIRCLLNCIFCLSCSDCYPNILNEVISLGGKLMVYLIDRIEDVDIDVASYSAAIFLQLCTRKAGRECLLSSDINNFLKPYLITSANYSRLGYQRALLISAALSRQREWRSYDPLVIFVKLKDSNQLENLIYLDYLETIKIPEFRSKQNFESLCKLSSDYSSSYELSQVISLSSPLELADYLCHPNDDQYFYNIPWEKICAACNILEAYSLYKVTANNMFSAGTVRFLGSAINLAKFELRGRKISDSKASVILSGMISAANCLKNLCETDYIEEEEPFAHLTSIDKFFDQSLKFNTGTLIFENNLTLDHVNAKIIIHGFDCTDISGSLSFFLSTMNTVNHNISPNNKTLQENSSLAAANLLAEYATMLARIDPNHPEIFSLGSSSPTAINIIAKVKVNYGLSHKMVLILDSMCKLLIQLTTNSAFAVEAIQKHNITSVLSIHLPHPLAGIIDDTKTDDEKMKSYYEELGYLPPSFFDLLTSLCKLELGKIEVINKGFLRRTLDKLYVVKNYLEKPETLIEWKKIIREKKTIPEVSLERIEFVSCIKLIERCSNFHSQLSGNANDLILSPFYDIVKVCKDVIKLKECPRTDNAYLISLTLLNTLSKDFAHSFEQFQKHQIIELFHDEIKVSETLPPVVLDTIFECIFNLVSGPQTKKSIDLLKLLQPSIQRTLRLLPKYFKIIADINFKLLDIEHGPGARQHDSLSSGSFPYYDSEKEESAFLLEKHNNSNTALVDTRSEDFSKNDDIAIDNYSIDFSSSNKSEIRLSPKPSLRFNSSLSISGNSNNINFEEELGLFGMSRANTANSTIETPSKYSRRKKTKEFRDSRTNSGSFTLPTIQSLDIQDNPEFKLTRPPKNKK